MKSKSLQTTPKRKKQINEALLPIPKTFALNQLFLNTPTRSTQSSYNQNQNSFRANNYGGKIINYSNNSSYYYEPNKEPFYIDTIQKVRKVLLHKPSQDQDIQVSTPQKTQTQSKGDEQIRQRSASKNIITEISRKKQLSIVTNNDTQPQSINHFLNSAVRDTSRSVLKHQDGNLTSRNRNITVISFMDLSPTSESMNREKQQSFINKLDNIVKLEKQMNISNQNITTNQSKLQIIPYTDSICQNISQIKASVIDQLNLQRQKISPIKQNHNEQQQTYSPDAQAQNSCTLSRNVKTQQGERQNFHENTFFRLEDEKALQFVETDDLLQMAEVAFNNINHQQILQKRKKLYQKINQEKDNTIPAKCNFIQKTELIQDFNNEGLNEHIKERIDSLQVVENYRYQKKYGLKEIQQKANQIIDQRNKTKDKIIAANSHINNKQETPFRKNSFVKHNRELSEYQIEHVHNRLYKQNMQTNQSSQSYYSSPLHRSELNLQDEGQNSQIISQNSQYLNQNGQYLNESQKKLQNKEIKDYQKILRDMKKQGEYYSKVSSLLNTIYFSTPEDSFKEEELKMFRRHQQTVMEDIKSKKKK